MARLRAVLDTNVIVSGVITPNGPPGQIITALREERFILIGSVAIASEVLDVLQRPKIQRKYPVADKLPEILALILGRQATIVAGEVLVASLSDPDDEAILATAVEGSADYLVTGDKTDLLILEEYQGTQVVTPVQFLSILN